ncbi:MAG TPA: ATP-binding protein [Magnetospirillum sp.]|nr:ATP-binding protein [Magnetospirillum sp.]
MPSKRGSMGIWAAAALVALAGSAASTWQILVSREAHLRAAEQLALSLSNAAAQRIAVSLRSMDVLVTEVAEKVGDPAHIDPVLQATLRTKLDAYSELDSMGLVDAQGWLRQIIHRDAAARPVPIDISDAPHVRAAAETWRERVTYLSPPIPEKFTKRTVLLLSRPIVGADDVFRGSAGLAVRTDFIDNALTSVVPAEGDAAGAFDTSGILYSRSPQDVRFVGKSIANSGLFQAFTVAGGAGTMRNAPSFSDGVERVIGFTPVPSYALVAAVGIKRDRVMDRWRREVWVHGGIQAAFVGVIFAMARRLSRSEKRRLHLTEQMLAAERAHVESLEQAVADRTAKLNASLTALSESEERFRRIVDISPLPLVLTRRRDGHVSYINAGAAEAFGIPQHQAEGRIAPDFWVHPTERARMIDTLGTEGQVRNLEAVLRRATGERFTALLSGVNVTLNGEDLVLIAVLDITERKRLEEDFARSNRDLEQFSYAVSHDLQEPLRMVSSYLALLDRRYHDKLDGDAHEFIAFAVDGAQRMSRMITDLLEYSRVHRRGNRFGMVALDQVLADALANLSTAIANCGAQVTADPLPSVIGDSSQLMRVFQNLIGNALKYRKSDASPHIAISAAKDDENWTISVSDDGIGIDPAVSGRLFQVFQRLHPRGVYEGTGVGLALCRRILERHGGHIWVESAGEGLGSTFRFSIPLAPPQPADGE